MGSLTTERRQVYQPLHPSIRDKLDPEYVKLHDEVLQYVRPTEQTIWTPESRLEVSPMAFAGQKLADVGSVKHFNLGEGIQIRVFIPDKSSETPPSGWPCLVWLHGGGWVNGGLNSENGFLRHICKCGLLGLAQLHSPGY
jgi:acetyl esterase/lipase